MNLWISTDKYKEWDLLQSLPDGWKIDKSAGSPLCGYEFCTNGKSVLNGQKRALLFVGSGPREYKQNDCTIQTIAEPEPEQKQAVSYPAKAAK